MAETKEVKYATLEELLNDQKPKKVFAAVEFAGVDDTEESTRLIKAALARISGERTDIKITACGVISVPTEEGHAQILPKFAFVDKKMSWTKAKKSDIAILFRLSGDVLVIEAKDVPPYTKLA